MMLLVVFQLNGQLYGLDGVLAERVVPLVSLRPVPHAPEYVSGIFNLQGRIVPVIDMCRLIAGRPSREALSTRIIVVSFPCADGRTRLLGLMAETVLEARAVEPDLLEAPVLHTSGAPYLGPVLKDPAGLIQIVELPRLIPEDLQQRLFAGDGET